jgi:copper homeostasis protein
MTPAPRVLLEVAVASVEDALAAHAGGADRLELNAALALGGLTPSLGTLVEVKAAVALPVLVMVRPRPGGFAYNEADFRVMQRDADLALGHGADGIVFGMRARVKLPILMWPSAWCSLTAVAILPAVSSTVRRTS